MTPGSSTHGGTLKILTNSRTMGNFSASIVVNERHLRVKRVGDGGFLSNVSADLHFGLGGRTASTIRVHWPDRQRTVTNVELAGAANRTVVISKTAGLLEVPQ